MPADHFLMDRMTTGLSDCGMNYLQSARQHLAMFFDGHPCSDHRWERGPMAKEAGFCVVRIEPGPKTALWTYCSAGASLPGEESEPLEFFILSPVGDDRLVGLITMTAHYHRTERLNLHHTLPIGEPWLPGSSCDCFLVSLPYTFGPLLERMSQPELQGRFLWLLPITSAERRFSLENGAEALEQRFDEARVEYWNPARDSVV